MAIYDTADNWLYLYDDFTVKQAAKHLELADVVVGYCSSKFDMPAIEGLVGRALRIRSHYDIYVEMVRTNADKGFVGTKGDFTLDAVSKRNLGRGKIDHGSNAKELIRLGHWGKLFNYCADDVHLTHDLFVKLCRDGGLMNPNGKFVSLPVPAHIQALYPKE